MKSLISKNGYKKYTDIIFLCLCVTAALFVAWSFTGQWPWKGQPYCSYILQAQSWLEGRLDLGQDYPYLELAIFDNKYFVSFPPFPSYVMLPFVFFGWDSCDGMIAFAASLAGAVYAYKIMRHFEIKTDKAIFFALLLTLGSNWFMTAQNAWVWFIAQNMAFTLSLMAIYYALKGKAGLSLAFWACAVGCRPMQIFYILVLLYIIYKQHKGKNPDDKIIDIIKKKYLCLIPMAVIALSYMILNFARFGNIAEFGHNYLPEFTRSENGQFSLRYILSNAASLLKIPPVNENGIFEYPQLDGMCIFLVSPIFITYIVYTVMSFAEKKNPDKKLMLIIFAIVIVELLCITAHKTMGGAHFGNRYTNDVLPLVFLQTAVLVGDSEHMRFNYPLFFLGFALNIFGTISYYI